jgi:hypothetical protein
MEKWTQNQYKDSTFNICEHQPLPHMQGPPMRVQVADNAMPAAVHTLIVVPRYCQVHVKADLNRDVVLVLIEPVPASDPIMWCSYIVITRQNNEA